MPVFDDIFRVMTLCAENFRGGVHDSFGASIITDILDPILKEIDSLRVFSDEFQRQALSVDQVLEDTRTIQFKGYGEVL